MTLYLDRCQVDTPSDLVCRVWVHIRERRSKIRKVVDFGAGDGRFARAGKYSEYIGYEIDQERCASACLPERASLIHRCAFSDEIHDADVCLGNPPYVRNQDLPSGWRQLATASLSERTGVKLSGLANAWQYFFLLSLVSTKSDGLVAVVIPYEWVSRPSAKALRDFIKQQKWDVQVYRLVDDTFDRVLTTSSITIVDKATTTGQWRFFEEDMDGCFRLLKSESGGHKGVVRYATRSESAGSKVHAKRGLSPGTQEVLTLTEGERVRAGLRIGSDVVPCVTSLRNLDKDSIVLTQEVFKKHFRLAGLKCWLIRTDRKPTPRLERYLSNVPRQKYQTVTCLERESWWEFTMPIAPPLLVASGFKGRAPKGVMNRISARAVGSVCGIYGVAPTKQKAMVQALQSLDLSERIVPHSNGLRKVEINQLNTLLASLSRNDKG